MKPEELKEQYLRLCHWKSYEPSRNQLKTWDSLLFSDVRDMKAATDRWIADQTEFPMPAQLRPFLEKARLARAAKSSEDSHLVRWGCPACNRTQCGWVSMYDREPRVCRGVSRDGGPCGEIMQIIHDDRVAAQSGTQPLPERAGRDGAL